MFCLMHIAIIRNTRRVHIVVQGGGKRYITEKIAISLYTEAIAV
jgi:hypothetical protein